jgi:large conductance mechanosensitive channel
MSSLLQDFKKFALRGNLLDMAIGFTVGAAFSTIAKSLVDNIIMPPIGLILGKADFSDLFVILKAGEKVAPPYVTLADAQAAGAVTINYGLFINNILALVLVALAMFFLLKVISKVERELEDRFYPREPAEQGEPQNKKCSYCLSTIPFRATRCGYCTSTLENTPADPDSKESKELKKEEVGASAGK